MLFRSYIDDPVGALSVHLVNGVFGTLAVGLFAQDWVSPGTTGNGLFYGGGTKLLVSQLIGIVSVGAFAFISALTFWLIIKALFGVRVSLQEEIQGLDIGEHGNSAYPDFVTRKPSYGVAINLGVVNSKSDSKEDRVEILTNR